MSVSFKWEVMHILDDKGTQKGGDQSVGVGAFSKVVLSCPHQPTRPRRSLDLHYSQAVSLPPPREHEASETHRFSVSIHAIDPYFWHVFFATALFYFTFLFLYIHFYYCFLNCMKNLIIQSHLCEARALNNY